MAEAYIVSAVIVGGLTAVAAFVSLWFYSAKRWQFPGFALGWLPAGIAAYVLAWLIGLGWPVFLLGYLFLRRYHRPLLRSIEQNLRSV